MAEETGKGKNQNSGDKGASQMTSLPRIIPKNLAVYYSNCALVTASHRELSVMFGRVGTADGAPGLAEVYERHIYMTVDQAIDVARRDFDDSPEISGKQTVDGGQQGQ